jgi:hypothetical protein
MEPPPKVPPDRARDNSLVTEASPPTMTAVAVSQPSVNNQLVLYSDRPAASSFSSISSAASTVSMPSNTASSSSSVTAPIEKLSRPMAFDKVGRKFPSLYLLCMRHKILECFIPSPLMNSYMRRLRSDVPTHHNKNHNYCTWVDFFMRFQLKNETSPTYSGD